MYAKKENISGLKVWLSRDKPQLGDGLNYNCSCTLCCFQFPLRFMFKDDTFFTKEEFDFDMSWKLIMATVFIWLLVALIYYKSQTIELVCEEHFHRDPQGGLLTYSSSIFFSIFPSFSMVAWFAMVCGYFYSCSHCA